MIVFHDPDGWLEGEPTAEPNAVQQVLSWIGLMPSADEKDLIKRVVGVGGDTIECKGTGAQGQRQGAERAVRLRGQHPVQPGTTRAGPSR